MDSQRFSQLPMQARNKSIKLSEFVKYSLDSYTTCKERSKKQMTSIMLAGSSKKIWETP